MYYYHPDHLGSSSYITDREGQIIQHTEYIAFGEVLVDEHSTTNKMPYLFNGKELDYETGLYYYGARYYDPKTSIFLNVDPLVEKTGTPYAYTYNNPINLIDPTGMEPEDWIKIGNRIFYDGSVNGTYEAQQKYGKDATAITGYHVTQGDFTTHYYLGKGGTVTTISGNLDFLATTKSVYGMRDIDTGAATIEGKTPIIQATIRQTPATNSMEYAMTTPSGRLAVAGYYGLEGAAYGIAGEFLLGKIGLSQGLSWAGAGNSTRSSLGAARTGVKQWLQNAGNLERGQLIKNIEGAGFNKVFEGKGMMHFERGSMKIRLDPPQPGTPFNHMHLNYGGNKNTYDIFLNPVNYKSPAAHIPIK